ncbi:retrovirus-related Pol polyprotein from transposon 412 [Trichonephila clavipes]|nr:retrovirus-related Pol polyprotein from transposon 412 [Trichonephila clavipes]
MKTAELKTLFEEAKSGSSKKNRYIVENNSLFFQKEDKDGTKRKCLVVLEKYRKNLMKIGHKAAAAHLGSFSRMGFPGELQTDQGTPFMSALTTEFLERFGVKVVIYIYRSSVYHPQCNPVERMHKTWKRILRVLCLEAIPDWEKTLSQALFTLRTAIDDSIGFSPAEPVHGNNLRTPIMLLYNEKMPGTGNPTHGRCKKKKLCYDRRTVKRQFQPGELVLAIAPSRHNKLSVHWVGPGEIVQQPSETNYVVKIPEKDKTHVYHVNMLKPYHHREENINLLCINPLKHDEEEDVPSLELENEMSGWSKIIGDVQLNSKLSQIQRGQLKELLYEYSNLFRIFLDVPI